MGVVLSLIRVFCGLLLRNISCHYLFFYLRDIKFSWHITFYFTRHDVNNLIILYFTYVYRQNTWLWLITRVCLWKFVLTDLFLFYYYYFNFISLVLFWQIILRLLHNFLNCYLTFVISLIIIFDLILFWLLIFVYMNELFALNTQPNNLPSITSKNK